MLTNQRLTTPFSRPRGRSKKEVLVAVSPPIILIIGILTLEGKDKEHVGEPLIINELSEDDPNVID